MRRLAMRWRARWEQRHDASTPSTHTCAACCSPTATVAIKGKGKGACKAAAAAAATAAEAQAAAKQGGGVPLGFLCQVPTTPVARVRSSAAQESTPPCWCRCCNWNCWQLHRDPSSSTIMTRWRHWWWMFFSRLATAPFTHWHSRFLCLYLVLFGLVGSFSLLLSAAAAPFVSLFVSAPLSLRFLFFSFPFLSFPFLAC